MIQCSKFEENRWRPNICCNCFLNHNTHKQQSQPILSLLVSPTKSISYEIAENLKSDYLLLSSKSAELNHISQAEEEKNIYQKHQQQQTPLKHSLEKLRKPIEKSLPLLLFKEPSIPKISVHLQEKISSPIIMTPTKVINSTATTTTTSNILKTSGGIANTNLVVKSTPSSPTQLLRVQNTIIKSTPSSPISIPKTTTTTTSSSNTNSTTCKEFAMNQWRPNICTFCFLPKSQHTTTTTTTTTTTMSSNIQSTTISTTTTITTSTSHIKPPPTTTTTTLPLSTTSGHPISLQKNNNGSKVSTTSNATVLKPIPPLLKHKSKSLPPKLLPKLSQASLEIYSQSSSITSPPCKLSLLPKSIAISKPILIQKSTPILSDLLNNNNNNNKDSAGNSSIDNDSNKRFSITISTKSTTSCPIPEDDELDIKNIVLEQQPIKSKRNSGTIQPLRLKSFSFCANSSASAFEDDPFADFEDLVDDDDYEQDKDGNSDTTTSKNETLLTITTPSQTTMVSSTTTILQSPRLIEKTTTTTSSIIPTSNNINGCGSNNDSTTGTTISSSSTSTTTKPKRRSIKMDQFKEKDDEWDQGVDLTTFLQSQRKKNSRNNTSSGGKGKNNFEGLLQDFSYCSNKFMEISSVKEEAQRQSVDFGGGIHPNAFEAFIGILEAKQKQIEKAYQRQKIEKSDCDMLSVELNSVKDLLNNLMENFNKNPPVIQLSDTREVKEDIKSHKSSLNNQQQQPQLQPITKSICISSIGGNEDYDDLIC